MPDLFVSYTYLDRSGAVGHGNSVVKARAPRSAAELVQLEQSITAGMQKVGTPVHRNGQRVVVSNWIPLA